MCAGAAQNECSKSPSPGTHSALSAAKVEPMARVTGSRVETPGPELRSHRLRGLKGQPRRGLRARCQGASGSSRGVRGAPAAAVPHSKSSSTEASETEGLRNCHMRPKRRRASRNRGPRFLAGKRGQRKGGEVLHGLPRSHRCITKVQGRAGQDLSHQ